MELLALAGHRLLQALVPVFVAIDVVGVLPIFLSLVGDMSSAERRQLVRQSVMTAFFLGLGFLAIGKSVFRLLGLAVADFKIAGGMILFLLATNDLVYPGRVRRLPGSTAGVVPLGTPLIVGPAVLTTLLICLDAYGFLPTLASLVVNLALVWAAFHHAELLLRILGENGSKAVAKVTSLLLAAIGVMMVRRGVMDLLTGPLP